MIFVTVGTMSYPFPRLINRVVDIYKKRFHERVLIQCGSYMPNWVSNNITVVPYLTLTDTFRYYATSDVVISSPGEVSFIEVLARAHGKVIFTPRLRKYKEHVDNQQEELGAYIQKRHLAAVVYDFDLLSKAIDSKYSEVKTNVMRTNAARSGIIDFLKSVTI